LDSSLQHVLSVLSLLCLHQSLSDNFSRRRRSLLFCVHDLTGQRLSHNELNSRLVLLTTPQYGLHRKHLSQRFFYCCVTQLLQGPRREHRFQVSLLVSVRNQLRPLSSNGRCLQSHYLATGLHATIIIEKSLIENRIRFPNEVLKCKMNY
jgi:hypothetical protein